MQSAPPFPATHDPTPQHVAGRTTPDNLGNLLEHCLTQTAKSLLFSHAANQADIDTAMNTVRQTQAEGRPLDLLEALARIQGHQEEHLGNAIRILGDRLAALLNPMPPIIPFAGKLIAPSAFYDSFELIHKTARILLTPVIYAEDTDAIGTASVNPVAALILAEEIRTTVFKRFGIRPFVTAARLDYESWTFLSRKHFEL